MHRRRVRKAAGGAAPFVTALLALAAGIGVASAALPPVPELATSPLSDDAFYVPPSPLPNGKPGDVIKIQDLPPSWYPNAHVRRIMYLSTDTRDNPVPVTGMLLTPLRQKPGTDNPLVVHTPGTRGLDDKCAPSKQVGPLQADPGSPEYAMPEYQLFLDRGISVVVTDYEGQGTPGDPSYLVGPSEGRNGLDAVRAAEQIKGSGLGSRRGISWLAERVEGAKTVAGCHEVGLP
jgi:hypothetical protein